MQHLSVSLRIEAFINVTCRLLRINDVNINAFSQLFITSDLLCCCSNVFFFFFQEHCIAPMNCLFQHALPLQHSFTMLYPTQLQLFSAENKLGMNTFGDHAVSSVSHIKIAERQLNSKLQLGQVRGFARQENSLIYEIKTGRTVVSTQTWHLSTWMDVSGGYDQISRQYSTRVPKFLSYCELT